jgi:phenylpropionate dioxygenase-like ring-hydroxylating dioxygenase large terminal subunit
MPRYGPNEIEEKYHKLLAEDSHPVPDSYRRDSRMPAGATIVPVSQFTSQEFHDLEVEKVWKRAWQMACHEDDIPEVGDSLPYDIADLSFLVVRTGADEFKAYYNACLHRGRKLKEVRGKRAEELRCPFHGWCWNLDGSLKEIPCEWDFAYLDKAQQSLPEVKVARWGRFVFINPDPDCEPLEDFVGDLSSHFSVLPYEQRYKEAHVAKIMRCNWKTAQEAFMEAYHVILTHPQIITGSVQDGNTKYDVFGNYSRAITIGGLETDGLPDWGPPPASEDGARDPRTGEVYRLREDGNLDVTAADGRSGVFTSKADWVEGELGEANPHMCDMLAGRQLDVANLDPRAIARMQAAKEAGANLDIVSQQRMAAGMQREGFRPALGERVEEIADIEFASVYFTLFPNFHPWGSFNRIVYRFRPHGNNPDESIMECLYMAPIPPDGQYPKGIPIHWLSADDDWVEATELGMLSKIFNQDVRNLPYVQEGMKATARNNLQLASYSETKLRHFHELLEKWTTRP